MHTQVERRGRGGGAWSTTTWVVVARSCELVVVAVVGCVCARAIVWGSSVAPSSLGSRPAGVNQRHPGPLPALTCVTCRLGMGRHGVGTATAASMCPCISCPQLLLPHECSSPNRVRAKQQSEPQATLVTLASFRDLSTWVQHTRGCSGVEAGSGGCWIASTDVSCKCKCIFTGPRKRY